MFEKYGVYKFTPYVYDRYVDEDHKLSGQGLQLCDPNTRGPVTSHLKAIKEWYYNSTEPYAIFCEDDISFDMVRYWNFTWEDFFHNLPPTWEIVQLALLTDGAAGFPTALHRNLEQNCIRTRDWSDWSCAAYLISRQHAAKIVQNYYPDDTIILEYKGWDAPRRPRWGLVPTTETLVYSFFEQDRADTVFSFQLLTEDASFPSTWGHSDVNVKWHTLSHELVWDWWKTIGSGLTIEDIKYKY